MKREVKEYSDDRHGIKDKKTWSDKQQKGDKEWSWESGLKDL